ncbi:MAG: flagellar M-ring protein FliF [Peptococcaceae bacterium]|nr:flagellar M-ring protein FliF [Peptococcaceae bacterium]
MNFSLTEILNSVKNYWKKLTRPQKVVLVLAPLVVATALLSLIYWASRPQYETLFTKLSSNEAGSITAKLKELKIDYQLSDSGATILVPQKQVSEVRLQLANAGLPKDSTFSFENLDQMRIGETDQDRRLRYILGLQNELETTIKTLNGVEYARVHIVLPEHSLFVENQKDTTAAVTIKTAYGTKIGEDQVRAIANLLAYSVEGLVTDKVTIVDTNGNVLSDMIGKSNLSSKLTANQIQVQQTIEENIQKSAQSMLDKVFGAGKTIVRANATLDFDQKKITSQKSENGAIESRQQTSEKSSTQSGNGGAAGTQSNVPGYPVTGQGNSTSTSEKTSTTENFKPSVTQEETVVSPGQIKRLTVSVLADSDSVTQEQVGNLQNIVSSAIGINVNRGDEIQVALLPFNKTTMLEEQAAMQAAAKKANIMLYTQIAGAVIAGIVFLVFLLRLRSRKRDHYDFDSMAVPDGQKLVTLEEAEQIFAAQMEAERQAELKLAKKKVRSSEEIEKEKVRKEVEKYTKENPDDVARLVKTWLTEEQ